ncbi:hypothetical protein B0J13DRAFT_115092 [Dactylonectria estremocensis]|uniref:Zn(2)-C6 fungal-type domain-containing protein n=1 Tax=Dactylonectria estremocensis TaxID=1079267 RepID=A0A9P9FEY5_9HYPO|nr:hypothetical protein B0J13DRAFT_115092 [Dactylonectria estremocensis]
MAPPDLSNPEGTPAGYGRSCTNCSRAKCKCILRPETSECERCHRLGKNCQPMTTSRKRVAKKVTASRTAQLEEKLDDLVSILRATQSSNQLTPPSAPTSSFAASSSMALTSRLDSLAAAATSSTSQSLPSLMSSSIPNAFGHANSAEPASITSAAPDINETYQLPEPTPAEAEIYFSKFREWLKNFPFMILSPGTTAASLREERPFLWLAIMNITTMSAPQQLLMKERVREEVATRVIINHERTMDVLLGLITYLAWATMTSGPGTRPFIITYSQLAVAVTYDLSLTRAPIEEQYFTVCFKVWGGRPPAPRLRSMEERRAVLALWFLTSVMTSFIGKMDTLRWTPHMDDCLKALERDHEHPSDEIFVAFIKYQLVLEDTQRLLLQDVMGEASQTPTYVFKKGLLARLQELRDTLPPTLLSNMLLKSHMLGAEVQVHSIGLFMQAIPAQPRIESMYACLKAARAWYDNFLSIPLNDVPGSPFSVYVQLSQIQVALYRLTTSEDPAWDKDLVRNTADLLVLLDQTIEMFVKLDKIYHLKANDGEETIYIKGAKIMRNIRTSWEPAILRHLGGIPTPNSQDMANPQPMEVAETTQPTFNLSDANSMDFGDMTWMTDVFGPWEF